jgi:hypothetical protein
MVLGTVALIFEHSWKFAAGRRPTAAVVFWAVAIVSVAACTVDRTPLLRGGEPAPDVAQRDADVPSTSDTTDVGPPDVSEDGGNNNPRVQEGLVVQYLFDDFDSERGVVPGQPDGPDLTLATGILHAVPGVGAAVVEEVILVQETSTSLSQAFINSNEITIEVWCRPESAQQSGPARLVEISNSTSSRNVMLGQDNGRAAIRVLDHSGSGSGTPTLYSNDVFTADTLVHIVLSIDADEGPALYVDGALRETFMPSAEGTFQHWDPDRVLSIANNPAGTRAWLGNLHLVALYDRALTPEEVLQNYEAGPRGEGPVASSQQVRFDLENNPGCPEGADCSLVLTRSGDLTEQLTVPYRIYGSAVEGEDFEAIPREFNFPPGESTQTLTVSSLETDGPESPELLTFRLLPGAAYTVDGPSRTSLVISDDQYPPWLPLDSWLSAALVRGGQGERRPTLIDLKTQEYLRVRPFTVVNQPKPGLWLHGGLQFGVGGVPMDKPLYLLVVLSQLSSSSEARVLVSLGNESGAPLSLVFLEGSLVLWSGSEPLGSWPALEDTFDPVTLVELKLKFIQDELLIEVSVKSEKVITVMLNMDAVPERWLGNYIGGQWTEGEINLSTSHRDRLMTLHEVMLYRTTGGNPVNIARSFLRTIHGLPQ